MSQGALEGIRILDFGQLVSAPFCAKLFADFGADVIKVEPASGDLARQWGPFPNDRPDPEKSGLFFFCNTNKRGITLDVTAPHGRDILLQLVRHADVLIENHHPAQMRTWGIDYPVLAEINPNLVMISITPFGQTGPYSAWNGYDLNAFHLTGASSRYLGRPGEMPLEPGTFAADFYGAMTAAAWGLAAVYGLQQAGGGQHIDVSCSEVIAAVFVALQTIAAYALDGQYEKRSGVGMSLAAPASILPCKDGHVWMLALQPGQWEGLKEVMGHPEWMERDMFRDMFARGRNQNVLYRELARWTAEHTKMEIMEKCQAAGCPATAVFTVAEAAEHPHMKEREYIVDLDHPVLGRVRDLGAPFKLPECPGGPRQPAPLLGQHNGEIYGGLLGMASQDIERLTREGVI